MPILFNSVNSGLTLFHYAAEQHPVEKWMTEYSVCKGSRYIEHRNPEDGGSPPGAALPASETRENAATTVLEAVEEGIQRGIHILPYGIRSLFSLTAGLLVGYWTVSGAVAIKKRTPVGEWAISAGNSLDKAWANVRKATETQGKKLVKIVGKNTQRILR